MDDMNQRMMILLRYMSEYLASEENTKHKQRHVMDAMADFTDVIKKEIKDGRQQAKSNKS